MTIQRSSRNEAARRLAAAALTLALAGCARGYEPALTVTPTDPAKYAADRKECLARMPAGFDAWYSYEKGAWFPGRAGDPDDPRSYAGQQRAVDDCLRQRGYAVYRR
jgi:hypothetical protein